MQYSGNLNYKYEWKLGDEWYPCHIYEDSTFDCGKEKIWIYTRNGTIMAENNVRKMSKEKYDQQTKNNLQFLGVYASDYGY